MDGQPPALDETKRKRVRRASNGELQTVYECEYCSRSGGGENVKRDLLLLEC